jgi:hypothetical protein
MNWDFVVGAIVLIAFILIVLARFNKQTVGELLRDIAGFFRDQSEDVVEEGLEVTSYE